MMKKIIVGLVVVFITVTVYANTTRDVEMTGEWKGAYIMNANVIPINVYVNKQNSELNAVVDYPTQQLFNVSFDMVLNGNSFMLKRTSKQGQLIQFKGTLNDDVITGSLTYFSEQMKDNPGTFQLMKSTAKHVKCNQMPSYSLTTFNDKVVSNDTFKGKYVLLDFWATWCPPCVKKRPKLEAIHKKYGDKIEIVSISLDKEKSIVQNFRESKFPMAWHNAIKPDMRKDPLVKELVPQGLPYGYILSPEGKILATGDELKAEQLEQTVGRILED